MSETKWTTGPWIPEGPDIFGDYNILHWGEALAIGAAVSNMWLPSEVRANAHLIAAAPELYEALNSLMGGDDKLKTSIGGNPIYVNAFITKARAVLSKARGESEAQS